MGLRHLQNCRLVGIFLMGEMLATRCLLVAVGSWSCNEHGRCRAVAQTETGRGGWAFIGGSAATATQVPVTSAPSQFATRGVRVVRVEGSAFTCWVDLRFGIRSQQILEMGGYDCVRP